MATYHNCSRGYLWGKGFAPFIKSILVSASAYIVFFTVNQYIAHNAGTFVMFVWVIFITYIWYRWYRHLSLQSDKEITWAHGWMGEHIVAKSLRELPATWHVFYDVRLERWRGNIDFVLVGTAGVYSIEVKNWTPIVQRLYAFRFARKAWVQTRYGGIKLSRVLASLHPHWIQTVLVLANQKTYSPRKQGTVDTLGNAEIRQYFADQELNSKRRLSDKQVTDIVSTLEHLAGCKTHKH